MSLQGGGHMHISELVDYDGISISDCSEKRGQPWKRRVFYKDHEFPTIAAAVDAFKWDHPEVIE